MKKVVLLFFCIAASVVSYAQQIKTDTVVRGYYIPLDSNVISCKVSISYGDVSSDTMLTGNALPRNLITKISSSRKRTVVVYYEMTVNQNGVLTKAPSVRYVVGSKNTRAALMGPAPPSQKTKKEKK